MQKTEFEERLIENLTNPGEGTISQYDVIATCLASNVPVLISESHPWCNLIETVKCYDPECKTIFMHYATLDSIGGVNIYDDKTRSMMDVPPSWYTYLMARRYDEKNQILHLKDLDSVLASKELTASVIDNLFLGRWELPRNTRIVATAKEKIPFDNELSNYFLQLDNKNPLDNYFGCPEMLASQKSYYAIYDDGEDVLKIIFEFINDELHKGNDISFISVDDEEKIKKFGRPLTPNSWRMAAKIFRRTANLKMLAPIIGEPLTNKFEEFLRKKYSLQEDLGESRKLTK